MTTDGFSDFFYSAQDGLRLHARVYGERRDGRLPVVCLAGLTRNARDFHELALSLSGDGEAPRQVVAFDYRGRGESAWDPDWRRYDAKVETQDIIDGLSALGIGQAAFIGTSRGGIIIHLLAAMRPVLIGAAVLNDIGPVVEVAGLVQIRTYLDGAPKPATFAEAAEIVRAAQGSAFSALADADWQRMTRAIYRDEGGVPVADYDPALMNTLAGLDPNKPLPELWPLFAALSKVPVLAIRGANSTLFSAATLDAMAARHPDFRAVTVAGQGHAPLLDSGDLPAAIKAFLAGADGKAGA
ncbi:MAG: alpha/beta hydrolase [Rhizobiaceae bacterium]|nr:MAG: alpha/beta hydrolase [Rhizobiaceae bacterium]CAG1010001.1 2-(acetamidomethylene)succinate hydrolase [Rhizobiaceae bacterium]